MERLRKLIVASLLLLCACTGGKTTGSTRTQGEGSCANVRCAACPPGQVPELTPPDCCRCVPEPPPPPPPSPPPPPPPPDDETGSPPPPEVGEGVEVSEEVETVHESTASSLPPGHGRKSRPKGRPGLRASLGKKGETEETAPALVDKNLRFVRLFWGTNRARTSPCARVAIARWDTPGDCRPNAYYSGFPAEATSDGSQGLEVGTLAVTFPPRHAPGKIERPFQVFTVSWRDEDPDKDVVISELRSFGADHAAWARELRATGRDQAFIYVHGFETSFDQAARRAAQLAYDLDFDLEQEFRGVPMFYSWPSRGGIDSYGLDYDESFESIDAFNRFLDLVKKQAGIRRVHVIAHSMGNRVVAEALYARSQRPEPLIDQLVLAAPDVWASRFKSRFLRTLPKLATRVTLYVSDRDRALMASSRARKGQPRAGEVAGGLLQASRGVERFDAINASTLNTDFLGHGYYASSASMLSDIYCLLKGAPVKGRPFLAFVGAVWQFRPQEELAKVDAGVCRAAAAFPSLRVPRPASGFPWLPVAAVALAAAALLALVVWRLRR